MGIGGQDLVCVKQRYFSTIPPAELRGHLEDLGDYLFSDGKSPSQLQMTARDGKPKVLLTLLTCNSMLADNWYMWFIHIGSRCL